MCRTRASATLLAPPPPCLPLFRLPPGRLLPFLSLSTISVSFAITTTTYAAAVTAATEAEELPSLPTPGGIRCTNREPRADQWRLAAGWSSREQPPRSLLRLALPRRRHPLSSLPPLPPSPTPTPPRAFSPFFLLREKTRHVPSRRVDPIREGELFL